MGFLISEDPENSVTLETFIRHVGNAIALYGSHDALMGPYSDLDPANPSLP